MSVFYVVRPYFTFYVRILRCTSVSYVVRPYFTLYIRIDGKIYKTHTSRKSCKHTHTFYI